MSKPRAGWWSYAKDIIRRYPALHREYEELHSQKITANLSGIPAGGGASRVVENLAIRSMSGLKQHEHDAVQKAIDDTKKLASGKERLQLVELVFWKRCCTVEGAGMRIHVSKKTAYKYHREFIKRVGDNFLSKWES